jgi:hypothetical protein
MTDPRKGPPNFSFFAIGQPLDRLDGNGRLAVAGRQPDGDAGTLADVANIDRQPAALLPLRLKRHLRTIALQIVALMHFRQLKPLVQLQIVPPVVRS